MIEFLTKDGRDYPRFICDHCKDPIGPFEGTKDVNGNLLWKVGFTAAIAGSVVSVHKSCTRDFERQHQDFAQYTWGAESLDVALAMLVHNTGIDMTQAKKSMTTRAEWGL